MKKLLLASVLLVSSQAFARDCTEHVKGLLLIASMSAESVTRVGETNKYVAVGTAYNPGSSVVAIDKGSGSPFSLVIEVDPQQCGINSIKEI